MVPELVSPGEVCPIMVQKLDASGDELLTMNVLVAQLALQTYFRHSLRSTYEPAHEQSIMEAEREVYSWLVVGPAQ